MASLEHTLAEHGYNSSEMQHAIPGVCLVENQGRLMRDLAHVISCPEGRTTVLVDQVDERWYVVGMRLEELLPLIPEWYGDGEDDV